MTRRPPRRTDAARPADDRPELRDVLSRLSLILEMERAQAPATAAFLETAVRPANRNQAQTAAV